MPVLWDGAVTAFLALLRKTMQPGDEIVMLPVQATYPGGQVKVKGTIVPVSGTAQLQPGQVVPVLVRRGVPHLAFAHSARRAQPGGMLPREPGIVEELLVIGEAGARDVWFRNYDQVTPLGLRDRGLAADPLGIRWGEQDTWFLTWTADWSYQVWALDRPAAQPYRTGQRAEATLIQTIDPFTPDPMILDLTYTLSVTTRYVQPVVRGTGTAGDPIELLTWSCEESLEATGSRTGVATRQIRLSALRDGASGLLDAIIWDTWLDRLPDGSPRVLWLLVLGYDTVTFPTAGTAPRWRCGDGDTVERDADDVLAGIHTVNFGPEWHPYVIDITAGEVLVSGTGPVVRSFTDARSGPDVLRPPFAVRTLDGTPFCLGPMTSVANVTGAPKVSCDVGVLSQGEPTAADALPSLGSAALAGYIDAPIIADVSVGLDPGGTGTLRAWFPPFASPQPHYVSITFSTAAQAPVPSKVRSYRPVDLRVLTGPDAGTLRLWGVIHRAQAAAGPSDFSAEQARVLVLTADGWTIEHELAPYADWLYGPSPIWFGRHHFLSGNARHALWIQSTGRVEDFANPQTDEQMTWVIRLADGQTGAVTDVGTDREDLLDRRITVLGRADLAHEVAGDGPRFIIAWDPETRAPTLDQAAADYPPADDARARVGGLAPLPEDLGPVLWPPPPNAQTLIVRSRQPWVTHHVIGSDPEPF